MLFSIAGRTINDKCTGVCEKVDKALLLNAAGKNKSAVVCRRCQSLIFPANVVKLVEGEKRQLKNMSMQGTGSGGTETVALWWKTTNDLDFDTCGWQTVDGVKVLMCGDCEFGPFGLREPAATETLFLVAAERVKYL